MAEKQKIEIEIDEELLHDALTLGSGENRSEKIVSLMKEGMRELSVYMYNKYA
ncbi:MAG: hypothetical protein ACOC7O_00840 [Thermoplasmatota archaeon]